MINNHKYAIYMLLILIQDELREMAIVGPENLYKLPTDYFSWIEFVLTVAAGFLIAIGAKNSPSPKESKRLDEIERATTNTEIMNRRRNINDVPIQKI